MIRAFFIVAILFTCWACTNTSGKKNTANGDIALHTSTSPKVLIELFTSQGCSSCPAADKLMGNMMTADTNVIALAYHVDYWDRSGWKDVFSNHDYTVRQQQYVNALHAESLYTPQAVVQGKYEMVGSNRARISDALNKVKEQLPTNQLLAATATLKGNIVTLHYQLSPTHPNQQMVIALVQNKATTAVARGENAGAQLSDYNVVRNLIIQPAHDNGSLEIYLPDDLQKSNTSLVLFIQDEQSKQVGTITQLYL